MNSNKILILLTVICHLERREISDKVLIPYKIPHILSDRYNKTRDFRVIE